MMHLPTLHVETLNRLKKKKNLLTWGYCCNQTQRNRSVIYSDVFISIMKLTQN